MFASDPQVLPCVCQALQANQFALMLQSIRALVFLSLHDSYARAIPGHAPGRASWPWRRCSDPLTTGRSIRTGKVTRIDQRPLWEAMSMFI